jgi:hypothetical protein
MPSESVLNAKIWPRIGLDPAPQKNIALLNNTHYKAELAAQFLLYNNIVIPTNDFGIVPVLVEWMGLPNLMFALESNSLSFIHHSSCLGYAGNGNGLLLFAVQETNEKKFTWWQKATYGTLPNALGLQIEHSLASLKSVDRNRVYDKIIAATAPFSFNNDDFMRKIVKESYEDVLKTPELKKVITNYYSKGVLDLQRLPEVGADQMRASGIEVLNDPVDFILRIAEVNLEIVMSIQSQNADLYTSEKTENILKSKIKRCTGGNDIVKAFKGLLELARVPDIENAIVDNYLTFDDILKISFSKEGALFRRWLQNAKVEDARDLEKAYVASLQNIPRISSFPVKALRFILTTTAGVIEPITGLVASAVDSFFVEKWLTGYAPKLFIDEMRNLTIKKH